MRAQQCKSLSTLTDSNIIMVMRMRCLVIRCLSLVIVCDIAYNAADWILKKECRIFTSLRKARKGFLRAAENIAKTIDFKHELQQTLVKCLKIAALALFPEVNKLPVTKFFLLSIHL